MIQRNSSNFESIRLFVENELKTFQWNIDRTRQFINENNSSEFRTAIEHGFRSILFLFIEKQSETNFDQMETSNSINESFLSNLRRLIAFAIDAVHADLAAPTMPVFLFNDLFSYTTIDVSEQVFVLLEEKSSTWRSTNFFASIKHILLRMCNDLLKRLSKTQKTVFSGRILTFLAQLFPLNEKSGLNQVGNFNTENLTKLNKIKSQTNSNEDLEKEKKMDVDEDGEIDDRHQKSSAEFYMNFWSLQEFFSKPFLLWETTSWHTFVHNTNQTLDVFNNNQLDHIQTVSSTAESFFAKYLTSEKLLELQLNDVTFRQNILVQFLIVFQYLTIPVKFKQAHQTLREEQLQWIKKTSQQVNELLKQTGNQPEVFSNCIQHILKREEMWNLWKNNGCPDFSRNKIDLSKTSSTTSISLSENLRQSIEQATKRRAMNFEDLRNPTQQYLPTVDEFFKPIIEQMQTFPITPEGDKERERVFQQDSSLIWRALRLLARTSPYFFVHNTQTIQSMAQFLVSICEKIRRENTTTTSSSSNNNTTSNSSSSSNNNSSSSTSVPVASDTNNDDDEDTTMDDEPIENPPSAGETNTTDHENDDEEEEQEEDENSERRVSSTKHSSN